MPSGRYAPSPYVTPPLSPRSMHRTGSAGRARGPAGVLGGRLRPPGGLWEPRGRPGGGEAGASGGFPTETQCDLGGLGAGPEGRRPSGGKFRRKGAALTNKCIMWGESRAWAGGVLCGNLQPRPPPRPPPRAPRPGPAPPGRPPGPPRAPPAPAGPGPPGPPLPRVSGLPPGPPPPGPPPGRPGAPQAPPGRILAAGPPDLRRSCA